MRTSSLIFLFLASFQIHSLAQADEASYEKCLAKATSTFQNYIADHCQDTLPSDATDDAQAACVSSSLQNPFLQSKKKSLIDACIKPNPTPTPAPDNSQCVNGDTRPKCQSLPTPIARPKNLNPDVPLPPQRPVSNPTPPNPTPPDPTPNTPAPVKPDTSNQKPDPGNTPPAANNNSVDSATAQANADADVASCSNLQTAASACCNNPSSCASSMSSSGQNSLAQLTQQINNGPTPGQSISDYCSQMNAAGANSSTVNNAMAAVCSNSQNSCNTTCSAMVTKYQSLVNNCGDGCDNSSIYQNALSSLNQQASTCTSLQAQAYQLADQGVSGGGTSAYSNLCQQSSAAQPATNSSPSSATPAVANALASLGSNLTSASSTDCTTSANSDGCISNKSAASSSSPAPSLGYSAEAKTAGSPNVEDLGDRSANNSEPGMGIGSRLQQAMANAPAGIVPNNSGGAVGGSNESFGANAKAAVGGVNSFQASSGGGGGVKTNIIQGLRSGGGGGSSPGSSVIEEPQAPEPTRAVANTGGIFQAFSLRQYLPGFSHDPRRIGGIQNADILGKGEDIFNHITSKMVERCRLERLYRCED